MENYSVYEDIASRTNGDIYVGVVGPVRTGKSTFIKRFMEKLVIPSADPKSRAVMTDELPQSAAGRTVMTTEPKFVPAHAVEIKIGAHARASVRLVDCVGFAVDGASGFEEDGAPRLVKTPWGENPLPFEEAASLGTTKVIRDHSTIGVLMTTDGSISEIPRTSYVPAEEKTVRELKEIGKPFIILLNCKHPQESETLRGEIERKYSVPTMAINAETLSEDEIGKIMQKVLFEFPVLLVDLCLPDWVQSLPKESEVIHGVLEKLKNATDGLTKMKDCKSFDAMFQDGDGFQNPTDVSMDLGKGKIRLTVEAKEGLFYDVLSKESGEDIKNDYRLMQYVQSLADAKRNYDKIKEAFERAKEEGYGLMPPTVDEMQLETPKLVKKGTGYGVHFKASAPSYHIVKVDVTGEVSPIVGNRAQGEEFVRDTVADYEDGSSKIWDTNIFGKDLRSLLLGELSKKTGAVPNDIQRKMRKTMTRIVNEGKGGIICILL